MNGLSSAEGIADVSCEVRRGEVLGLAGLIGAGRTEVARALFGVQRRTAGEVVLDGKRLEIDSPADAIHNRVALLTEDRKRTGLCLDLPCAWNVTLPNLGILSMKRLINPRREVAVAAEAGARIRVKWGSPLAPADSLSGGNQQKLLIARWLTRGIKLPDF